MTSFDTNIYLKGIARDGWFFYEFQDIYGKRWRIITRTQIGTLSEIFGYIVGELVEGPIELSIIAMLNCNIRIRVFLGGLVPGIVEPNDIRILGEH